MITPRTTFKSSTAGKSWNSTVGSASFEVGATVALAQMEIDLGFANDMATAAAHRYMMQGAKVYLKTLMNLTIETPTPPQPTSKNLRH